MLSPVRAGANSRTIRILLVDDHPAVRFAYRALLEEDGSASVVAEGERGEDVCTLYFQHRPDLAIIDLNLPGLGGLEAIRRIVVKDPLARILVFSAYESEIQICRALEAGALGYITKRCGVSQMKMAVSSVAAGNAYIDPVYVNSIAAKRLFGGKDNPLQVLSPREFQIFESLARGESLGDIAAKLFISPKTVSVHQSNLMRKLGMHNVAQLVRMAIDCQIIDSSD